MADLATTLTATDEQRLTQAEALVRAYCGWHISPSREETVEVRAQGGWTLALPSMHVTAVASVADDGTALTVEDDYTWSTAGILTRLGYWGAGTVVEVTFTHGYAVADLPAEITAVVQAIAQRAVNNPGSLLRAQAGPFGSSHSQTGTNQALPIALLDAERAILARYRLPSLA